MAKRLIDPRILLLQVLLTGLCIFFVNSSAGLAAEMVCICFFLLYLGLYRQCGQLVLFFLVVSLLLRLLENHSITSLGGMVSVLLMLVRKMSPAAGIYFFFTRGISVSRLIAALEKLRLPKSLVLSLAVALRFVPTIQHELGAVKDALRLRGQPVNLMNIIRAPLTMGEHVLIPFMMRAIKVGDELSASAVTRGIENTQRRTSRHRLRINTRDILYGLAVILSTGAVLAIELF